MNDLKRYTILGIVFTAILGTLSHFVYDWTGNNFIVGLFFPVNESTWEHIKLLFFPMLLYSIYMSKKLSKEYPCINSALLSGILIGAFSIPVIFYTYSGILGYNIAWLDIAIFFICVIIAFITVYKLALSCKAEKFEGILIFLVCITALLFIIFTIYPPDIGIFKNPADTASITKLTKSLN